MRWFICCIVLWAVALEASAQYETCYAQDEDPYIKFATKTSYEFAKDNSNRPYHLIPNCEPIFFWSLTRHGIRLPEAELMSKLSKLTDFRNIIVQNYDSGNGRESRLRMCRQDVENLRSWIWNPRYDVSAAGDVIPQAFSDIQTLARSWKERFPQLITNNPRDYLFKYSEDKASKKTYQAYIAGLFRDSEFQTFPHEIDEKFVKPQNYCSKWSQEVGQSNDTNEQLRIFTSKQDYRDMIANVSARLGFSYTINDEDVLRMYEMCRLYKAWDITKPSAWCAVFSREDLRRLEYAEDLETYYKYGYGSPLNQKLGCVPVKDLMKYMTDYVEQRPEGQPKAVVQIVESPLLLMALGALSAHRDPVPLTGDNYRTPLVQNRKWRTSSMDPYGANIVAVLYRCRDGGEQYKVMFLENERPLLLEDCRVGLCDWSVLKQRLGYVASKCDVAEFCNNSATLAGVSFAIAVSTILALALARI